MKVAMDPGCGQAVLLENDTLNMVFNIPSNSV